MNIANDKIRSGMIGRLVRTAFSQRPLRGHLRAFLAFCLVTAMAIALTPSKAYAAVPEVRAPLHAGVEVPSPLAVFGSNIVFGTHRSTNGGSTWTTDPALAGPTWMYVGNGKLVGYTSTAGSYSAVVYTVATGKSQTYPLPGYPQSMNESWALTYAWPNPVANNFVTGETGTVAPAPTNIAASYSWPLLMPSGGLLWTGWTADTYLKMYAVAPTPTAVPGDFAMIDDFGSITTLTQLLYVHQNGTTAEICARPLANLSAAPICAVGLTGVAVNMTSAQFANFGTSTVIDLGATVGPTSSVNRTLIWNGSTAKQVAVPAGSFVRQPTPTNWNDPTYGDTPYLVVRDSNTLPSVMKVAANGKLQKGFPLPRIAAAPATFLAVAPDRVAGGDARDGSYDTPVWVRSVSGSGFGPESMLGVRSVNLVASAGRTVVGTEAGLTVYDRGVVTKTVSDARVDQLSGPYIERLGVDGDVVQISTVNGDAVKTFAGLGTLFGSEFVGWTTYSAPSAVTIDDLTGATPQRTVQLAGDTTNCGGGQVWGDKLYVACFSTMKVFSLSNGALVSSLDAPPGGFFNLVAVGDGYAVVTSDNAVYNVWDLASGALSPLTDCRLPIATDGVGHVACASSTELIWRDYSALSTSAPRLLGTLADASVSFAGKTAWSLAMDTTKALKAGAVVISNASGTAVRSLPVAASNDGSVRVAWDGLDATGKAAPAGVYSYKLLTTGADASGSVVSITGTGTPSGTVSVTAPACQDTAPNGHGCHR